MPASRRESVRASGTPLAEGTHGRMPTAQIGSRCVGTAMISAAAMGLERASRSGNWGPRAGTSSLANRSAFCKTGRQNLLKAHTAQHPVRDGRVHADVEEAYGWMIGEVLQPKAVTLMPYLSANQQRHDITRAR